ncbi:GumC family protein [Ruegeria arenilitoris]|uniref:GumC family protein n=1 Tax=Ruegeria arenilitoris TaxID=1173585 RepID=UPI0034645B19
MWSRHRFILGCALLCALGGVLFALTRPELYQSSALVRIGQSKGSLVDVQEALGTSSRNSEEINITLSNELRVIKSSSVLQEVINSQGLISDPYFNPRSGEATENAAEKNSAVTTEPEVSDTDQVQPQNVDDTTNRIVLRRLQKAVEIEQLGYSQILKLSVTADEADKAARITNAIVQAYLKIEIQERLNATRETVDWLNNQLSELEAKMQESADAVDKFRRETGLGDQEQSTALSNSYSRLQDSLSETIAQRKTLENRVLEVQSGLSPDTEERSVALEQALEASKLREAAISNSLNQIEERLTRQNVAQFQLVQLERKANADALIFERFLEQIRQADAIGELTKSNVGIVEIATPPLKPIGPGMKLLVAAAFIAGGFLGVVFVLLQEAFRSTIETRDELEKLTGLPVISSLPLVHDEGDDKIGILDKLVSQPYTEYVEALRAISYRLLTKNNDQPVVVAITSSIPGEGKTLISMALALFHAHFYEKRQILIDCDLRRSQLSRILQGDDYLDLGDYLLGRASASDVIQPDPVYNLDLIPSHGSQSVGPDILSGDRFKELIENLKKEYDIIILDTPPITPVQDISMISHSCDEVFFVVSRIKSTRELVTNALKKLRSLDITVSGIIFNAVDLKKEASYRGVSYYSYSDYHKG